MLANPSRQLELSRSREAEPGNDFDFDFEAVTHAARSWRYFWTTTGLIGAVTRGESEAPMGPGIAVRSLTAAKAWFNRHDPDYGALRRAARTALIMPALFALGDKVIGNPALATFAAFGSFAMLLLVDFSGPMTDRLLDQAALGIVCGGAHHASATLVSRTTWLAAVTMAVVAFAILFAGVVSSVLAGATTALLLSFILPVSLPGTGLVDSRPGRGVGDRGGRIAARDLAAVAITEP